ncbi:MAG: response regulator transcription factor [Rhodopirellula sp.]|nr:response regulator transcription factor [Rhodopirellula sp.]
MESAASYRPPDESIGSRRRKIRVLLADDHRIIREGIATFLMDEDDIQVVGQACDGQEAVELAEEIRPDVVLMDVTMPRLDGIEATRRIKRKMPQIRVIGLSMHATDDLAKAMRSAGASAYLAKNDCCGILIDAIRSQAG